MKKIIAIAIMLIAGYAARAQQLQALPPHPTYKPYYHYTYDDNGNRVSREEVIILSKTAPTDSIVRKTDSTAVAATAEAAQQDQQKPASESMLGEQKVTVFPNPTSGQLQIDITNFIEGSKGYILATDMQGRVIYKIENINATNIVNLSSQAKGNYTLKLVINNTSKEWVIIKE